MAKMRVMPVMMPVMMVWKILGELLMPSVKKLKLTQILMILVLILKNPWNRHLQHSKDFWNV